MYEHVNAAYDDDDLYDDDVRDDFDPFDGD